MSRRVGRDRRDVVTIVRDKGGAVVVRPAMPTWPLVGHVTLTLSREFDPRRIPPAVYALALIATERAQSVHIVGGQIEAMRGLAEVLGAGLPPRVRVTWDDPHCSGIGVPSTRRLRRREW